MLIPPIFLGIAIIKAIPNINWAGRWALWNYWCQVRVAYWQQMEEAHVFPAGKIAARKKIALWERRLKV